MMLGVVELERDGLTVDGCGRCGGRHERLSVRRFARRSDYSDGRWYHWWAMCPATDEPLSVGLLEADGTTKSREEIEWPT